MPCDMVRLPCGSMSTHSTRCPCSAKAAARFSVVVVLATPPFWLAKAITLAWPVTSRSVRGRGNLIGHPRSPRRRGFLPAARSRASVSAVEHVGAERRQARGGGEAEVPEPVLAAARDPEQVLVAAQRRVVVVGAGGVD